MHLTNGKGNHTHKDSRQMVANYFCEVKDKFEMQVSGNRLA